MLVGKTYAYTSSLQMRIDGYWYSNDITLMTIYKGMEEVCKTYKTYDDNDGKGRYFKYCVEKVYNCFGKVIKYIYKKIYLSWFEEKE